MLGTRNHNKGKKQTKQNSIRATHHRMVMVSKSCFCGKRRNHAYRVGPKVGEQGGLGGGSAPEPSVNE